MQMKNATACGGQMPSAPGHWHREREWDAQPKMRAPAMTLPVRDGGLLSGPAQKATMVPE